MVSHDSRLVGSPHWSGGRIAGRASEGVKDPVPTPVIAAVTVCETGEASQLLAAARAARLDLGRRRRVRLWRRAAWGSLALLGLSPIAGLAFPEQVVDAFPATIRMYEALGKEVNVHGLVIRDVEVQHLVIDGHRMIAVKGEVANISPSERQVPILQLGFGVKDSGKVHHLTLDIDAQLLGPGQSTSFAKRFPAHSEAARNLEIRFARAGEIGSNKAP